MVMKELTNLEREWLAKRNDLAKRITYLLASVRTYQKNQFKESDLLTSNEIGRIALHLAEIVYPNPLNKKHPLKNLVKIKTL